jgi:hypothetical protein
MRRPLLIACILAVGTAAGALNLAPFGADVVSSSPEGERTIAALRDSAGRTFTVSLLEDPSPAIAAQVIALKDAFYAWRAVKIGSLRFTVTGDLIETVIFPESIVAGGSELRYYLPAGLFFSWSSAMDLEYDFRVTKDNLFLRVSGVYKSEEEMENRIAEAIANPGAYLQRGDTEYLLSRLDEAQKDIAALREAQVALQIALDAARYAAMTRENVEWLFFPTPIPRDGITRILALKKENPVLTRAEAAGKLKAAGIAMTDQEIRIVFKYCFGE